MIQHFFVARILLEFGENKSDPERVCFIYFAFVLYALWLNSFGSEWFNACLR